MTNKEIKLELAKVALERCNFMTSETFTENLKNLYDWIVDESDDEVEVKQENQVDSVDIKKVLKIIRKNTGLSSPMAATLEKVFYRNNINTVGDLLRIGKNDITCYEHIGKKTCREISDALEELFGVTAW